MDEKQMKIMALQTEISGLQAHLANSGQYGDYRIIKTYEARLKGEKDPYDTDALLAKRQEVRDRINALQAEIEKLEAAE